MKTLVAFFTLALLTFGISFAGQADTTLSLDELTVASSFDSDFVASTFFTPEIIEEAGRRNTANRNRQSNVAPTFFTPEVLEEAGRSRNSGRRGNASISPSDLDTLYAVRKRSI